MAAWQVPPEQQYIEYEELNYEHVFYEDKMKYVFQCWANILFQNMIYLDSSDQVITGIGF